MLDLVNTFLHVRMNRLSSPFSNGLSNGHYLSMSIAVKLGQATFGQVQDAH